jgi:hypothetical protein
MNGKHTKIKWKECVKSKFKLVTGAGKISWGGIWFSGRYIDPCPPRNMKLSPLPSICTVDFSFIQKMFNFFLPYLTQYFTRIFFLCILFTWYSTPGGGTCFSIDAYSLAGPLPSLYNVPDIGREGSPRLPAGVCQECGALFPDHLQGGAGITVHVTVDNARGPPRYGLMWFAGSRAL